MRTAAVVVLCFSSAAWSEDSFKIAAPGLQCVRMPQENATFLNDHVTQRLIERGMRVYTQREIQTAIGMERQKQLLGCASEDASCLAELAGALGVDAILFGNVGQFGKAYQINVKVLAAGNLAPLATFSARVDSEEALLSELTRGADLLATQLQRQQPERVKLKEIEGEASIVTGTSSGKSSGKLVPIVITAVGAAAVAAGIVLVVQASSTAGQIRTAPSAAEALRLKNSGLPLEAAGWACLGVGVAAAATGVVMLLMGGGTKATASMMVTPDGASVGVAGVFP